MDITKLPQNTPLYEQVAKLIENQIINGELEVGDKLPTEKELTEMYQVSRTVIREAITALKQKGWVETWVAKGTFVVQNMQKGVESSIDSSLRMSPKDRISNLIQVRLILEPEIAALAAEKASQEQINQMKWAVQKMQKALEAGGETGIFLDGDFIFHMALADSAGNDILRLLIDPVVKLMRETQRYHLEHVEGGSNKSQSYHKEILLAVENHDPDTARDTMRAHIIQVRDDVMRSDP